MPANYDTIARIYDLLSRMIYGGDIVDAQECMLPYIHPHSSILIVGGGTGWLLESLSGRVKEGLDIDYVESSAEMIRLSEKRGYKGNKVNFIHQRVENFVIEKKYDAIITPFIFDNFQRDKIDIVFAKLDQSLKENGAWLYADFVYEPLHSPFWHKVLLRVMYLFFRITTGIETQKLVPMNNYFAANYTIDFEAFHYFKFMKSIVYRKK